MVKTYTEWQAHIKRGISVEQAMQLFSYEVFCGYHKQMQRAAKNIGVSRDSVVKEEAGDEDGGDGAAADASKATAKALPKGSRDKCSGLSFLEHKLAQPPEEQFASLLVEVIKAKVLEQFNGQVPNSVQGVEAVVSMLQGACDQWSSSVGQSTDFGLALDATRLVFACLRSEGDRPPVRAARDARRQLNSFGKQAAGACADLAKAMCTMDSAKAAVEAALAHSRAGIEDHNAMKILTTATTALEEALEPCADDFVKWVRATCNGTEPTFQEMCKLFGFASRVVMATMTSLVRLSPFGLATGCST